MVDNIHNFLKKIKDASRKLVNLSEGKIHSVLADLAVQIPANVASLLEANQKDLSRMSPEDPKYDRLLLSEERLLAIADDIQNVVQLPSPLGKLLEKRTLENGMEVSRFTVPMGVIGVIYEARPNVTFDVFSLCFKSSNAVVLKGSGDAVDSNKAIVSLIHEVLQDHRVETDILYLLPQSREAVKVLMDAIDYIDVIIPRGGKQLIDFVRKNSRVPVIETGAGIVHTYIDEDVDISMAASVILNAKTRRVSVCNALDTLIIHEKHLCFLPKLLEKFADVHVELFADEQSYSVLKGNYPDNLLMQANEGVFGVEFLSLKMSIKVVSSLQEAIEHIMRYSSKHSEAILSKNPDHIEYFIKNVDAAVVYSNASTAFTDGAELGLGAEIGISTQKLHARGPMGLQELTSYKWVVMGEGQVRPT